MKYQNSEHVHANRHVAKFLSLSETDLESESKVIQVVNDGTTITAKRLLENKDLTLTRPILVKDSPSSIGMKVLSNKKRQVSVRDVSNIIGEHYPVHVIDVEHQEELEGWTMGDLVDYFEDEERLLHQHQQEASTLAASHTQHSRRRRKAAEKCITQTRLQRPRVLNQISLEFSKTDLKKYILSPKFVRDLDWIDHAWPRKEFDNNSLKPSVAEVYPNVQYYCLTSAAGCYTDFHVDFGGTAVWYHVMTGEKIFCLIPPTNENLKKYEHWLCQPDQAESFLPDVIQNPNENVIRISLKASQTLVIPTAWIHAVYTPKDSVVLGGNFLHGLDIPLQLDVHCIESRTRVQEKFRFPFFLPLNFYAGGMYLQKLRHGLISKREVKGLGKLIDALREWWNVHRGGSQLHTGPTVMVAAKECAKKNGCETVEDFLLELRKEHQRVEAKGICPNPAFSQTELSKAPSPIKPKIRLKLKGDTPSSKGGKFRIVLSSSAMKMSATLPVKKTKRVREDKEYIDDGNVVDDDWTPSSRQKIRRSIPNKTSSHPGLQKTQQSANSGSNALGRQATKSKTTSKQRLMKRLRS